MKRTYEKERVAALSAGLAIIVLAWIADAGFCLGLDRLYRRSFGMALRTDLGGSVGSLKRYLLRADNPRAATKPGTLP